jgi:hypothetical protein
MQPLFAKAARKEVPGPILRLHSDSASLLSLFLNRLPPAQVGTLIVGIAMVLRFDPSYPLLIDFRHRSILGKGRARISAF